MNSQNEKMKAIKEKAQKDREFIAEIRRDETKY
jgi:hypothetical protein